MNRQTPLNNPSFSPRLRQRIRFLFAIWLCGVLVVSLLSLAPASNSWVKRCSRLPLGGDKGLHFSGYAGLSLLAGLVFVRRVRWMLSLLFLVCLGIGLEFGQARTPSRSPDKRDALANTLGVATGAALVSGLRRRFVQAEEIP